MTLRTCRKTVVALIVCLSLPAWGQQYYLYTPHAVTPSQITSPQDGIMVQEVEIQKGDTLSRLSRKFSGHGMYFPQILLFNSIKDPDLIYAGKMLKIPVTKKRTNDSGLKGTPSPGASHKPKTSVDKSKAEETSPGAQSAVDVPVSTSSTELSLKDLKTVGTRKSTAGQNKKKNPLHSKKSKISKSSTVTGVSAAPLLETHGSADAAIPAVDAHSGQKLFEAAVKAYRLEDCRTALELLDRYLADNSNSPLAADANLYKAECYLKLSAQ